MVSIIFGLHEPIPVQGRQGMEEAIFYSTDMEIIDKSVMMNPYCRCSSGSSWRRESPWTSQPRTTMSAERMLYTKFSRSVFNYTLLEKFWPILLFLTDDAVAKLYVS